MQEQETGGPDAVTGNAARRVLIVDDNVDAGESLGMLLASEGHQVRVIRDGGSCIAAAREFRPDVILLDIGLPDISGYDLAPQIRAQRWDKPMLLVAVTGWGQPADKEKAFAAGFDEHLTKPAELDVAAARAGHGSRSAAARP
jgi:CheY-like chemotaxis protein